MYTQTQKEVKQENRKCPVKTLYPVDKTEVNIGRN